VRTVTEGVGAFAEATAVQRSGEQGSTPLRTARYVGEVAEGWDILGNANGGYLLPRSPVQAASSWTGPTR
jgi:hypothetical protein